MLRATLPLLVLGLGGVAGSNVPDFGPNFNATTAPNMNGDFILSDTPGAKPGLFPKHYKDYPGGVESFEVYSPAMTTLYSQVWWAPLAPAAFPQHIVEKYAGKGMAIVGWEIDQVRKGAGPNGEDVPVPISASYNHHYGVTIIGAAAHFDKVVLEGPDDPRAAEVMQMGAHGHIAYDQEHYVVEQVNETASGHPASAFATSANGGEYRKSFHGYPPGYALVVDSPTAMQTTPMQIDTWNRAEMDISGPGPAKFVPGPLPSSSQAPAENALYSGLLECPMTTRLTKVIDGTYTLQGGASPTESTAACAEPIMTSQECFHAASALLSTGGQAFINQTASDPAQPRGCSVTTDPSSPLLIHVFFNKLSASTTGCGHGASALVGATHVSAIGVNVSVSLDAANDAATITLSGPSHVWFGVGMGAQAMVDQPWTIVVDGNGGVSEYKLGGPMPNPHIAGTQLKPSIKVISSSTNSDGARTVVLTRPLKGEYFTFNSTQVPFITAIGSGPKMAYHKNKAPSTLSLLPLGSTTAGACVCPEKPKPFGQATGHLVYRAVANQSADVGTGSVAFGAGKCQPYPATTQLRDSNPTCDVRHYRGGQWACHHKWSLLDAEQEIPWPDQPLVFQIKYRFYVQPFTEGYHVPVHYGSGSQLLLGSPWEFDVPKCGEGIPGCSLVDGTWTHTVTGSKYNDERMVYLNFHCHAPTCLMMSVYACPKGTSLEACANATSVADAEARGYTLLCRQEPVYGGTGDHRENGTHFDEQGYIAIPDCLWGSAEQGLEAPLNLTGVPLFIIKTSNATIGHYGEMAGGQPFCESN